MNQNKNLIEKQNQKEIKNILQQLLQSKDHIPEKIINVKQKGRNTKN
jgi:hypothetical protein